MQLSAILKDSDYKIDLFANYIEQLEQTIIEKETKNGINYYVSCLVRKKEIKLTPEEIVRQLYIYKLRDEYGYAITRMHVEYPVHFGREVKRADIVIMDKIQPTVPYIIIEVKKPQTQRR